MEVIDFLTLFGGLAFFLYGMSVLSNGLEKLAGGKLETTLKKVTSSKVMSFLLGAVITIAIQSSSAMTVMLVGLVNSGIMEYTQTLGVILGSNVGTTLTAWILSLMGISGDGFSLINLLSPAYFSPIIAFVGIMLQMLSKKQKKKDIGVILVGFAILMYGMQFMSTSVSTIEEMPAFKSLLLAFDNPIIAVLISTVFTGIIQSSAATVGIVQALAITGTITYNMAIPLVLGANIGTCMTALLSSIGTGKNAKRVVAIHIYVKVIGTIVCLIALGIAMPFISDYLRHSVTAVSVAVIHTVFNLANTVVIYPISPLVIKLAKITIRGKKGTTHTEVYLDDLLLSTPPIAIEECRRLTEDMANITRNALTFAIDLTKNYSEKNFDKIIELETLTDKYEDALGSFLVKVSAYDLSEIDSKRVGRLLHTIGDLERIADHAENIAETAKEMNDKNIRFSEYAGEEIEVLSNAVKEIVGITVDSFASDDVFNASMVEPLEQVIDSLKTAARSNHITRMQEAKCTLEIGFSFSDLITNYERIADHCSNIAVYTIQLPKSMYDTHNYLQDLKNGNDEIFSKYYNQFKEKYTIRTGNNQ